jgi:hypothetical protein
MINEGLTTAYNPESSVKSQPYVAALFIELFIWFGK